MRRDLVDGVAPFQRVVDPDKRERPGTRSFDSTSTNLPGSVSHHVPRLVRVFESSQAWTSDSVTEWR